MDTPDVEAYLNRVGMPAASTPDDPTLIELHERHLMTVPFENLDFHYGTSIALGQAALEKVVLRWRGGTCRELNGSTFADLLRALGYPVTLLASRVHGDGGPGTALGHTVIRVDGEVPWLVDVGFGRGSRYPLRMDLRTEQKDPHGTFILVEAPHGDLDLLCDGKPVYRIETRPRELEDFLPVLWWYQNSPDSPFVRHQFCSLVTDSGRVTLSGDVLIRTENGHRNKYWLKDEDEVRDAYRDYFNMTLDRLPPHPEAGVEGMLSAP
ncbi:arylamine N-acetyltransferase family protein [Nocardiopsis salina]|uniref:arylamine N-acetyltransferase family protein n=1 Tax=Nocardiopsis salina TaxID=245836 RepID=UPI0003467C41|nr:arylamine N-acetyltransferase [Nocardiopsis salina]